MNTFKCTCPKKKWINQSDCSRKLYIHQYFDTECYVVLLYEMIQQLPLSVNCKKAVDMSICASQGGSWDKSYCKKYSNVPVDYCPKMCRLCP